MKVKIFHFGLGSLGISLVLGSVLFLSVRAAAPASQTWQPAEVGNPFPVFSLPDLDGEIHSVSSLSGQPAIINFWASWCTPCEQEMPLLQDYAGQYPQVTFVGINSGENPALVAPFLDRYGITFPVWLDLDAKVTDGLRIIALPVTYFLDSQGIIRGKHLGQLTPALMERYLQQLEVEP